MNHEWILKVSAIIPHGLWKQNTVKYLPQQTTLYLSNPALFGVIVCQSVAGIVKNLPAAICRRNEGTAAAAFDYLYAQMKNRHQLLRIQDSGMRNEGTIIYNFW
jgi:hypothetical protein